MAGNQGRELGPIRAFVRFDGGNDSNDTDGAYGDLGEMRSSCSDRPFGVLRQGRGATGVRVILMVVGVFGRDGVARFIDGVFGNYAVGVIVVHGFFLGAGNNVDESFATGDHQFAGRLEADFALNGTGGAGNDAHVRGEDFESFGGAIVGDVDGAVAQFGDGRGLSGIKDDGGVAEQLVSGLANAHGERAIGVGVQNVSGE